MGSVRTGSGASSRGGTQDEKGVTSQEPQEGRNRLVGHGRALPGTTGQAGVYQPSPNVSGTLVRASPSSWMRW
jgi:hypothetical protein